MVPAGFDPTQLWWCGQVYRLLGLINKHTGPTAREGWGRVGVVAATSAVDEAVGWLERGTSQSFAAELGFQEALPGARRSLCQVCDSVRCVFGAKGRIRALPNRRRG